MEDDAGPVLVEDLAELAGVLHVADDRGCGAEAALAHELSLDLEERRLGVVEQHELGGPDARDLPAELGADGAPGSRDQNDLAREVARDGRDVDVDGLAAEHVLHLDGAQLAGQVAIPGDEVGKARERLHGDVERPRRLDDAGPQLTRRGRDRDQHLVGAPVADDVLELRHGAEHAHAVQSQVPLAGIVVQEPDRGVAERRVPLHLLHDELARVPCTDDDHLLAARDDPARERALDQRAGEEP